MKCPVLSAFVSLKIARASSSGVMWCGVGCGVRDAGCGMGDTGCGMRDARWRMEDAGYRIKNEYLGFRIVIGFACQICEANKAS